MTNYKCGYPLNIVPDESKRAKLLCQECCLILHKPMQRISCGHRFCEGCFVEIRIRVEQDGQAMCRNCSTPVITAESIQSEFFDDVGFLREHGNEIVLCPNEGCTEQVKYRRLDDHVENCVYRIVSCENQQCNVRIPFCKLPEHLESNCEFRTVVCEKCHKRLRATRLDLHTRLYCPMVEMCEIVWNDTDAGCPFQCKPPEGGWTIRALEEHRDSAYTAHLDITFAKCLQTEKRLRTFSEFSAESFGQEPDGDDEQMEVQHQQEPRASSSSQQHEVAAEASLPSLDSFYLRLLSSDRESLYRLLITYEKHFSEMFRMPAAYKELKEAYDILLKQLQALKRNDAMKTAEIESLRLKLCDLEEASYNGVLLWRINKWDEVMRDAVNEVTKEVLSPFFYTGKFGYKMQLMLYPNGSQQPGVTGQYLSLHLRVLPGQYDPLLKFPFRQRITFILEDQDMRQPILETYLPTIQVNSSYGSDRFVKLTDFIGRATFVKNNCVFIRCLVDCSDLQHY